MQLPRTIAPRTELWLLAGILALGLVLRIGAAIAIPSPLESDYLAYWTIANNANAGLGLADETGQPTAFMNVGYPFFLWSVLATFGASIAAGKAANVVLGLATILCTYAAARMLFRSWLAGLLAALVIAVYLEAVVYTAYMAKENLMNLLVVAQLALAVAPVWRRWWVNAVGFGLLTGAMAMVGNAGLSLLPGLVLLLAWNLGSARATLRYLGVAAIVAGIAVAPLLWRNQQLFGAAVLNNNGGFNLYIGNHPGAGPLFQSIADTPLGPEWQALRARLGERGIDVMLRDLAIRHIIDNPGATAVLALRKGVAFWAPPTHAGNAGPGSASERIIRLGWLVEFCAIGLLFFAAPLARGRLRPFAALCILAAGYTGVHMIFYVIYRYRLPIMPVLCIGAAAGIEALAARVWPTRIPAGI